MCSYRFNPPALLAASNVRPVELVGVASWFGVVTVMLFD